MGTPDDEPTPIHDCLDELALEESKRNHPAPASLIWDQLYRRYHDESA